MIVDDRMVAFINSFDKGNTPFLNEIEKYAIETEVPIIRKEMQAFLRFLLTLEKPMKILEVGTAIGFSALFAYFCKDLCIHGAELFHAAG